jgi:methylmalonyl-CoA/ethylmalonyl-CoA epimerase
LSGPRLKRVSHLGLAVHDLDAAIRLYRDVFGLELDHRWTADADGMEAAAFKLGEITIELMQPTRDDSPVAKFLAKRGEGLHHVAYEVGDVGTVLREVRSAGLETIDAEPRVGGDGRTRIGFVHPKSMLGVLTELEQHAG